MKKLTEDEKHKQILKEVKATMILIAIVAIWHIGFAFALDGIDIMVFGMPLWFFVSTIGAFVISVVGVIVLLKVVFVDFDLGDEVDEKNTDGDMPVIDEIPGQILMADVNAENTREGGEV